MTRLVHIAPAIFMAALSALIIHQTRHLSYWSEYSPGPAFAPWWVALCGLILSGLLVVHTYRTPAPGPEEEPGTTAAGFARAAATFATLVAFLVLIPLIGLVPASMLTAAVIMLVILRRALVPSLASMFAAGGVIYGIFEWWLNIPLPTGPLGF